MIQKTGSDRTHRMIASAQTARAGRAEIRLRIMSTVRASALDAPLDASFGAAGFVSPGAPTGGFAPMSTWASPAFCRAKSALQNIFQRKTPSLSLRLSDFASGEMDAITGNNYEKSVQHGCTLLPFVAPCCPSLKHLVCNRRQRPATPGNHRAKST
jgi:hypothetical protein